MNRVWEMTFNGTLALSGALAIFQLACGQAWDAVLVRMAFTIIGLGMLLFGLGCWALQCGLFHPQGKSAQATAPAEHPVGKNAALR